MTEQKHSAIATVDRLRMDPTRHLLQNHNPGAKINGPRCFSEHSWLHRQNIFRRQRTRLRRNSRKNWSTENSAIMNCYTFEISFQHKVINHKVFAKDLGNQHFVSVNSITKDYVRIHPLYATMLCKVPEKHLTLIIRE